MTLLTLTALLFASTVLAQVPLGSVQHKSFNSPEGWALKYFTSATLMSGLPPPRPVLEEPHKFGSVTIGFEMGWLPELSPERASVGFSGRKEEDLNKTPIF